MDIQFSERAQRLMLKMQKSTATNQDWFLEHVKQAQPGKPLDYDPRLGLTRNEYSEFLKESKDRRLAATGRKLTLSFKRTGDILSIDIAEDQSPLGKLRLNVTSGELRAAVGNIGKPTWKSSNDPQSPIGPFEACSWHYEAGDLNSFDVRIVGLDIYRLRSSGKILWQFKDSEMVHKKVKEKFEILFQHSPGAARQQ